MRLTSITPEFVKFIPFDLADGVLYVSMPYGTAVHLCACGCGNKTVTPIGPSEWQIAYDGEAITLTPSILNRFPCGSHYWIRSNQIEWA